MPIPNRKSDSETIDMHKACYRALFDNPLCGVFRTDKSGQVQEVNDALVAMMGCDSVDEVVGSELIRQIVDDNNERVRLFETTVQSNKLYKEFDWTRKDGELIRVRVSGRAVLSEGLIHGYQVIIENISEQREMEEQVRIAQIDALTGLPNYRRLQDGIQAEIKRSARTSRQFSVILLDLDDMKQINDVYGHLQGNRALCRVAQIMRQCCRSVDTPARFGGDEFAVVLPETSSTDAWQLAIRVFNALNLDQEQPKLSVSLGCATYPVDGQSSESLLGAADRALYEMKNGRQLQLFVSELFRIAASPPASDASSSEQDDSSSS